MSYQDLQTFFSPLVVTIISVIVALICILIPVAVIWKRIKKKRLERLKIKVVIRQEPRDIEIMKTPEITSDGVIKFVMEKPSKGKAGWTFTCPDGSIRTDHKGISYVEVYRGSPKAIVFDYEGKNVKHAYWDKDASKKFIEAEALIRRYGKAAAEIAGLKMWIFITLILVIVCICVIAYVAVTIGGIPDAVYERIG